MKTKKIRLLPLETGASEGATAYLKVEKPHLLFLEGSTDAVVAAGVAPAVLPDASVACAGASAGRAASSVDRLAAGASALTPGTCYPAACAARGEGGTSSHLSEGTFPPSLYSSYPSPDDEYSEVARGGNPAARAAGIPRPAVPGAPAAGSSAPSYAPPALAPASVPRVHALGLGA
jgi:hypothetical protein